MEVLTNSLTTTNTTTTTITTPNIEERGHTIVSIILMSVISCALFMFLIFIFYIMSIKYSEYMDSRRLNIQINNYIKKSTQNFSKLYEEKNELSEKNCCICLDNKSKIEENSEDEFESENEENSEDELDNKLDSYNENNNIIVSLKCGHYFHKNCIDKWFSICNKEGNSINCPICRNNFNNV